MASPVPRLVITDSSGRRQVAVEKGLLTIGRRTESDVHVTAVGVSRHHAEIATENGTSRLRDLDSKRPDEILFADFDETLRTAMQRETELFISSV